MNNAQCIMLNAKRKMHNAKFTMHYTKYAIYNAQCKIHNAEFNLKINVNQENRPWVCTETVLVIDTTGQVRSLTSCSVWSMSNLRRLDFKTSPVIMRFSKKPRRYRRDIALEIENSERKTMICKLYRNVILLSV